MSKFQLIIKSLTPELGTFSVGVQSTENGRQLKEKIAEKKHVEANRQRLIFQGNEIKDDQPLSDCTALKQGAIPLAFRVSEQSLQAA